MSLVFGHQNINDTKEPLSMLVSVTIHSGNTQDKTTSCRRQALESRCLHIVSLLPAALWCSDCPFVLVLGDTTSPLHGRFGLCDSPPTSSHKSLHPHWTIVVTSAPFSHVGGL